MAFVVLTNSDHVRGTAELTKQFGAKVLGPAAERDDFPLACSDWLREGSGAVDQLTVLELQGSKTPGELALLIGDHTLVVGDLVRAHQAGRLHLLPDEKLASRDLALDSVRRLLDYTKVQAVLVGDGWPIFRDGHRVLRELVASLDG